jgi:hypothetical protein
MATEVSGNDFSLTRDPEPREIPRNTRRVYVCPSCPYETTKREQILSHTTRKHGPSDDEKACRYCDYRAPNLYYIQEHTKFHFKQWTQQPDLAHRSRLPTVVKFNRAATASVKSPKK